MQVTKCDRCGYIFDRPRHEAQYRIANHMKLSYIVADGTTYYNKETYDICPECAKDLVHWFEEKKETD